MSFLIPDELCHEFSHRSRPGRRAARVTSAASALVWMNDDRVRRSLVDRSALLVGVDFHVWSEEDGRSDCLLLDVMRRNKMRVSSPTCRGSVSNERGVNFCCSF